MKEPTFDLVKYVQNQCSKMTMQQMEYILHHYIDNPIEGELTPEKIKAAGIRTAFYHSPHIDLDYPVHEDKDGNISMKFDSGLIGIAQGHTLIKPDGTRRPLTNQEEDFLTNQGL